MQCVCVAMKLSTILKDEMHMIMINNGSRNNFHWQIESSSVNT